MKLSVATLFSKKNLVAVALALAGTPLLFSDPIRYSGSDFLNGAPAEIIDAAVEKASGEKPVGRLRGSTVAEKELRTGAADVALILSPGQCKGFPEVKSGLWRVFPLAYQVAYVVVASANPAEKFTFRQLSSIFGNYSDRHAANWTEAGVNGFAAPLAACVGDRSRTCSVSFFQRKVLQNYALRPFVRTMVSDELAFRECVNKPGTIAIVSTPIPVGMPLKAVAVADDGSTSSSGAPNRGITPYSPSFSNIYNGDYPLSIPLCVVYPTEKRAELRPLLSSLYSKEMSEKLAAAGFLPLSEDLRAAYQKGIDNIR